MRKLILLICSFIALSFNVSANFTDIPQDSEYYEAINYWQSNGVIEGYEDNSFKPNNTISREEAVKIIVVSKYNQEEIESCDTNIVNFSDISSDRWSTPYLCIAIRYGIIQGYPDGTFKPTDNINLVEAAKIILKTGDYDQYGIAYQSDGYIVSRSISPSVYHQDLTRAEFSEGLYRYKVKQGSKLPFRLFDLDDNKSIAVIKSFDSGYYTDGEALYRTTDGHNNSQRFTEVDLDTFEVVKRHNYAKDQYRVYPILSSHPEEPYIYSVANPNSEEFKIIDSYFYTIGKKLYYHNILLNNDYKKGSLEKLTNRYAKDNNNVYWHGNKIEEADPATFIVISIEYTKDENNVYRYSQKMPEVDVESIEMLYSYLEYRHNDIIRDKNHVYCNGQVAEDADPETFTKISDSFFFYDKNSLFRYYDYHLIKIKNEVTPEDIEEIENGDTEYYKNLPAL